MVTEMVIIQLRFYILKEIFGIILLSIMLLEKKIAPPSRRRQIRRFDQYFGHDMVDNENTFF